jgi:hypothetical protein
MIQHHPARRQAHKMLFRGTPREILGAGSAAIEKVRGVASQGLRRLNLTQGAISYEGSHQLTSVHGST